MNLRGEIAIEDKVKIDYQRGQATVSLIDDEVKVLIISNGTARMVKMHDYGELILKTNGGKVTSCKNTESILLNQ